MLSIVYLCFYAKTATCARVNFEALFCCFDYISAKSIRSTIGYFQHFATGQTNYIPKQSCFLLLRILTSFYIKDLYSVGDRVQSNLVSNTMKVFSNYADKSCDFVINILWSVIFTISALDSLAICPYCDRVSGCGFADAWKAFSFRRGKKKFKNYYTILLKKYYW